MEQVSVTVAADGSEEEGVVGKKASVGVFYGFREVINVTKEEERAENSSLGDS